MYVFIHLRAASMCACIYILSAAMKCCIEVSQPIFLPRVPPHLLFHPRAAAAASMFSIAKNMSANRHTVNCAWGPAVTLILFKHVSICANFVFVTGRHDIPLRTCWSVFRRCGEVWVLCCLLQQCRKQWYKGVHGGNLLCIYPALQLEYREGAGHIDNDHITFEPLTQRST